jgi:hypothetical protein
MTRAAATAISRRDALGRVARVGGGALAALGVRPDARAFARSLGDAVQIGGVDATPPLRDPRFPMPPAWETELKAIAPNVYAYIQAGGPGRDNASAANAGIIVGDTGGANSVVQPRAEHAPPLLST